MSRALVFTRTKRGADRVARHLDTAGIRVAAIHGNKSQPQRRHALETFPRRQDPRPGGDRHRRARHRHRRCDACGELRAAGRAGILRPPHRPHRPRRRRWHRHLALRRRRARAAARHRAPDPAVHPGRGSAPAADGGSGCRARSASPPPVGRSASRRRRGAPKRWPQAARQASRQAARQGTGRPARPPRFGAGPAQAIPARSASGWRRSQ